jgi:hypothetical protein
MTKRRMMFSVVAVAVYLVVFGLTAGAMTFACGTPACMKVYAFQRDFTSIFISLAAAYLSYCIQQRVAFLSSLRELWRQMIAAKNALVAFTHDPTPTKQEFSDAIMELSLAIDQMRGVYRNVGESTAKLGQFPFEPLHDMRRTMEALKWKEPSEARREHARAEIERAWNSLRWKFLHEVSAPFPDEPITVPGSSDPRRPPDDMGLTATPG